MSASTKTIGTTKEGCLYAKVLNRQLSSESLDIMYHCFGDAPVEICAENIEVLYENGFSLVEFESLLKDGHLVDFRDALQNFIFGKMEEIPRPMYYEFLDDLAKELGNPHNWR